MHGAHTVLAASLTALTLCSCRSKQVPEPSSTHTAERQQVEIAASELPAMIVDRAGSAPSLRA
jgi:hypothetical protein